MPYTGLHKQRNVHKTLCLPLRQQTARLFVATPSKIVDTMVKPVIRNRTTDFENNAHWALGDKSAEHQRRAV